MGQKNEKPQAELIGTGKDQRILIRADVNTEFSRKVRDEDKVTYPGLFPEDEGPNEGTKDWFKAELTAKGVGYTDDMKKSDLQELLDIANAIDESEE